MAANPPETLHPPAGSATWRLPAFAVPLSWTAQGAQGAQGTRQSSHEGGGKPRSRESRSTPCA